MASPHKNTPQYACGYNDAMADRTSPLRPDDPGYMDGWTAATSFATALESRGFASVTRRDGYAKFTLKL